MVNDLPNLKADDKKDYRFSHLYDIEIKDYNLVIVYHEPQLSKEQCLNFLKLEGII